MKRTLQFSVYKGMGGRNGAMQLNFQPPHYYQEEGGRTKAKDFTGNQAVDPSTGRVREGWKTRDGAVFLEITSAIGKNVYDWENKVTIALSPADMGKILLGLTTGKDTRLMHDPGAKTARAGAVTKSLSISSPKGILEGGAFFRVQQKTGDSSVEHSVPLSPDECLVVRALLSKAVTRALNW